jgi:serine/threonine protein kinase
MRSNQFETGQLKGARNSKSIFGINENSNLFATQNCSDIRMYTLGKVLGKGAYATVYESVHKASGERVAIK